MRQNEEISTRYAGVMIVDDSQLDQMICQRAIKRSGLFEGIISFANGQTALNYLSHPQLLAVDLILLDLNMPGIDGFEFVQRLSENADVMANPPPPVLIMLTIDPPEHLMTKARATGCVQGTIAKPITSDGLLKATELLTLPHFEKGSR